MIEATCSACGTINRIAEGDVPAGAKFLPCTSCKSRVVLPTGKSAAPPITKPGSALPALPKPAVPKPAAVIPPPIPRGPAAAKAEIADLPTPKRQGALAGLESSKPAPKSGLDIVDLPAPKAASLPADLPTPKIRSPLDNITDLPAPKGKTPPPKPVAVARPPVEIPSRDTKPGGIVDLPTPKGPKEISDLPAPKRMPTPPAGTPMGKPAAATQAGFEDIVDLPAPKGGIVDLPMPKPGANADLPAPKGFFDDLPQPASAAKQAKGGADLPAPKGFFDDLPQPAKSSTPQLPVAKGPSAAPPVAPAAPANFFDDLPEPTKPKSDLPAPKGFFDDDPPPAAPKPAAGKPTGNVFDDLPEPTARPELSGADLLGPAGSNDLDLSPGGGPSLDLDPGPAGTPALDLGLDAPRPPPQASKHDFGDLDLSAPTALPPPAAAVKSGISINAGSGIASKPKTPADAAGARSGELKLDLEEDPARPTPALKRDAAAKKQKKGNEVSPEALAKQAKLKKILLGAVAAVAVLGAGGGLFYKRYASKQARQAAVAEHLQAARGAIHGDNAAHWNRASSESAAVLETDDANVEALGLRAESLIAGALDNGVGGEGRIAQGRHLLAEALEKGVTGPQLATAQALGMIASNQADRAITALQAMTKRDPKNGFLLLYLGWAQVAKNDPASAVKSFDAALATDPKTKLPALYARGRARLALLDLEGAKADFAAVLDVAKEQHLEHIGAQVGLAASQPASQSSQREADLLAILARKDIATADPRAVVLAWTLAGDTARAGGRLDVARERYRQALAITKLDVAALVGLARVEIKDAKLAIASDLVQKALSQSGDNAEAMLVAAELYIRQGKLNDALAIAQKLGGRVPPLPPLQRANLQLVIGNVLEAQSKDEDAIDAWIEGAKVAGDLDLAPMMAAVTKLGALAKKASDNHDDKKAAELRDRADKLLSSLADRAQDDPQLSKTLGAAYLGADDPAKAEHFLRRAVEMRGNDIETRLELAKALARLNRTDDALEQLRAAQQIEPARLDIALELARTLEGANRDADANEAYTKLLAAKEPPVQARVHAGRFFARKGDLKRAAEQADPILRIEPDNAAGHYLKGEGYLLTNKLDEARKELTTAVDGDPDPQYLDAQGRAAEASAASTSDSKYFDLALRAYERAIEAAPTMINPPEGTGRVYIARKEWTKAIPPLAAAIKLDPKNPDVMYNLGLAYKNLGQPGVAVDWLVAAARDKQDPDTWWQLGQLYQDANRGPETAKALNEATRLARDKETKTGTTIEWLTDAWYRLGQTQHDLNNYPAAKYAFEQFVGRNPPADQKLSEARRLLNGELKSN